MLTKLERYIDQLGELNNKLIVLAGPRGSGKTKLLQELGKKLGVQPLNVNLELGRRSPRISERRLGEMDRPKILSLQFSRAGGSSPRSKSSGISG